MSELAGYIERARANAIKDSKLDRRKGVTYRVIVTPLSKAYSDQHFDGQGPCRIQTELGGTVIEIYRCGVLIATQPEPVNP